MSVEPFSPVARPGTVSPLGVTETEGGYEIAQPRWFAFAGASRLAAVIVLVIYGGLFLRILAGSPYWGPISTVDEQVTYYQVARNFNRFGFLPTAFLQDMSTASDPRLHPVVYNHMPPGPEILTALLMRAVGDNYRLVRLSLGVVFFAGLACYLGFARLVLGRLGLGGAGFTLAFLAPFSMLHAAEHPAYAPFPLLAFLPLLLLHRHYRTGRRWPLGLALLLVLVSSVYLVYQHLFMLMTAWIALAAFQIVRFDRRDLIAFLGAAVAGIGLHAVQSVVLLGPGLFIKETAFALSNRALGIPTSEALKEFYRSIDVVHHGTHRLDLAAVGTTMLSGLRIAEPSLGSWRIGETTVAGALLVLVLAWGTTRFGRRAGSGAVPEPPPVPDPGAAGRAARRLAGLGLWMAAAIVTPSLMFPAYSIDYGLSGMGEFFLALTMVAALGTMLAVWFRGRPRRGEGLGRRLVAFGLLALIAACVFQAGSMWYLRTRVAYLRVPESNPEPALFLQLGEHLGGRAVMTNVYPTTVGFFTQEVTFGGCERAVFAPDGGIDPEQCHVAFVKGFGRGSTMMPTHFVLFRKHHLTGFTRCRDECLRGFYADLGGRYPVAHENALYTVFDVTGAPTVGPPRGAGR